MFVMYNHIMNTKRDFQRMTFYHLYNRGHRKARLYRSAKDYRFFINLLYRYIKSYDLVLISYCLMPNHFHMILRLGESKTDISRLMQRLKTSYAIYFNRKYVLTGTPFQGKYLSSLIDDRRGLLNTINYIERNPVEAKLRKTLGAYEWLYTNKRFPY
jgi:putative transposase